MLSLRWQGEPLSGEGAARFGGRWNRPGQPALYLSADHGTAVEEYHQSLVRPGTLCGFDVTSDAMIDVRDHADTATCLCAWRSIWQMERQDPPTWPFVDRWIEQGAHGALFPSAQRRGGVNLVLWRWNVADGQGARVEPVDPDGELARHRQPPLP